MTRASELIIVAGILSIGNAIPVAMPNFERAFFLVSPALTRFKGSKTAIAEDNSELVVRILVIGIDELKMLLN